MRTGTHLTYRHGNRNAIAYVERKEGVLPDDRVDPLRHIQRDGGNAIRILTQGDTPNKEVGGVNNRGGRCYSN